MLFRSIVNKGVISSRRRHDLWLQYPLFSLLGGFECVRDDEHISYGSNGATVPPFGCTFSTARDMRDVMAVANEEGIVRLYNTESRREPILKEWLAHDNAVFDIAWVPGEPSVVTASGDQTAKLWDVKTSELLGTFKGHQCSLKSVAFTKQEKAVFCTGGRDGNIMVWDTRCSKKDGCYRQVKQISNAHNKTDRHTPSKIKRKKHAPKGILPSVDSQQSVTVVLFRDEHTLISAGAVDGTIKMWDLRKNYTAYHQDPVPLQVYPYPGSSVRKLGYSGLTLDSSSTNLFSNCTDDNIYMFNIAGLKTTPVAVFSGHLNSSFYVKSTVSPDDQFLVSGSSDHQAYIWKISDPGRSPMMLQGHCQEVTSVMWCPTDFTKIASCSDDNTIRVWRLNRGEDGARPCGGTHLVGRAYQKLPCEEKLCGPVCASEHTPGKNPRAEGPRGLASPQLAACAPSSADLPLPSNTPTTPLTPGNKGHSAGSPKPMPSSSTSIQDWFFRVSGSPGAPRKVLGSSSQSVGLAASPEPKGQVKRRLETDGDEKPGRIGACDLIAELHPVAKRSRGLAEVCCFPPPENQGAARGEDRAHYTSARADKENSIPPSVDWLSALGQKLRSNPDTGSPARSLNGSRKPHSRPPTSPARLPGSMKKISSYFLRRNPE
ncbi:denticleless protein homolog [Brienomyrus brachyistius]|uniref:denticleless protein homolog n=1 Tax=Brienomyrus brachyistius TaxID=42636 RepID=UPI0020B2457F|nr:denticleless protein homolog [Brienomyrus brachyistius]